jgi:hypothetical protein
MIVVALHTLIIPFTFALEEPRLGIPLPPIETSITQPIEEATEEAIEEATEEPLIGDMDEINPSDALPLSGDELLDTDMKTADVPIPLMIPIINPKDTMHWRWDVEENETKSLTIYMDNNNSGLWIDCGTGAGPQLSTSDYIECEYAQAGNYEITILNPEILKGNLSLTYDNVTEFWAGRSENIKRINLSNNKLTSFASGAFDNLPNIEILEIESNALHSLPTGMFTSLKNLKSLSFMNNQLTTLPADLFNHIDASELRYLVLSNNQITHLPAGIFKNLSVLSQLNLSYNRLSTLSVEPFTGLNNVFNVDFSYNPIISLSKQAFEAFNPSSTRISLINTCLNTEDNEIITYLNTFDTSYSAQSVCAQVQYTPQTPTV